ncbi:MAG TPA: 6,7-dimethyl-8-ribityllumazine synthase [Hyphomicrobium sp.]|nr:6,7-dimethyl-8-ribityllumazine synthase [Hyphomicrobium sp.]
MVQKTPIAPQPEKSASHLRAHILIIEAPYYDDIAGLLAEGAVAECEARGMTFERVVVPGALEIPQVFAAAAAARAAGRMMFDGAVALGCVIRGETAHYDVVCDNANHWLMEIAVRNEVPVGNAILTVDTHAQAVARAEGGVRGKGGDAVRACARLIETKRAFWGASA